MKFKSSKLHRTLHAIKTHPKLALGITGFDAAFLAAMLLLNYLLNIFLPATPEFLTGLQRNALTIALVVLFLIIYFGLIILIYSFFSLLVLGNIKSMHSKHKTDFSMFKRMFVLNIFLFLIFFIIFIIFNVLGSLLTSKSSWVIMFMLVISAIILFFSYVLYNFMHSFFILGHDIKYIFRESFRRVVSKSYLGLIASNLVTVLAYMLFFFLAGLLFQKQILANYQSFITLSSWATIVLIYLVFGINRIYFFFIALDRKG